MDLLLTNEPHVDCQPSPSDTSSPSSSVSTGCGGGGFAAPGSPRRKKDGTPTLQMVQLGFPSADSTRLIPSFCIR
jgi:hypothetical protein